MAQTIKRKGKRTFIGVLDRIDEPHDEERDVQRAASPSMWRSNFLFDAIAEESFLEGDFLPDSPQRAPLIRIMTTDDRLGNLIGRDPQVSGIYRLVIDDDESESTFFEKRPLAWLGIGNNNFDSGYQQISRLRLDQITYWSGPDEEVSPELRETPVAKLISRARSAYQVTKPLSSSAVSFVANISATWGKIIIEAIDVGQGSFVAIHDGYQAYAYFDVGEPLWFNWKSRPAKIRFVPPKSDAFVVLSHWDFDHFLFGIRHPKLRALPWYAPSLSGVGPRATKLALSIPNLNTVSHGTTLKFGNMRLFWGTGGDRNNSGMVALFKRNGERVLLTGDADYNHIPPHLRRHLNGISVSHHGARTTTLPPNPSVVGSQNPKAVISAGHPNVYRHPNHATVQNHNGVGWTVRVAGKFSGRARGNKKVWTFW